MKLTKAAQKAVLKNSAICAGKLVLESLFHEVADFQAFNVTEETPKQVFFCYFCFWKVAFRTILTQ